MHCHLIDFSLVCLERDRMVCLCLCKRRASFCIYQRRFLRRFCGNYKRTVVVSCQATLSPRMVWTSSSSPHPKLALFFSFAVTSTCTFARIFQFPQSCNSLLSTHFALTSPGVHSPFSPFPETHQPRHTITTQPHHLPPWYPASPISVTFLRSRRS